VRVADDEKLARGHRPALAEGAEVAFDFLTVDLAWTIGDCVGLDWESENLPSLRARVSMDKSGELRLERMGGGDGTICDCTRGWSD
jgi:hypothetical protein